jgi:hypothetical protein
MLHIDPQTMMIIALVAFILGILVDALLTRPRYSYRGGHRRFDD